MQITNGSSNGSTGGLGVAAKALCDKLEESGVEVFMVRPVFDKSVPLIQLIENEVLIRTQEIKVIGDPSIASFSTYGPRWSDSIQISQLIDFFERMEIDVYHFHHLIGFGPDFFHILKIASPKAKFIYTFHDAGPICLADGQLFNYSENSHCKGPQVIRCEKCLHSFGNSLNANSIFLNMKFGTQVLEQFDVLTSPSRYVSSKVEQFIGKQCLVIENIKNPLERIEPRQLQKPKEIRNRIGYFGQVTFIKGVDTLIDAVVNHNRRFVNEQVELHVFGSGPDEYLKFLSSKLERFEDKKLVVLHGPYVQKDMVMLLKNVDWVAVPSRWAENAPLVISEALSAGRPLLLCDSGGKSEMVKFGLNAIAVDSDHQISWGQMINEVLVKIDEDRYREMTNFCGDQLSSDLIMGKYMDIYAKEA